MIGYGAIAQTVCVVAQEEGLPLTQVLVRPGHSKAIQAALPKGIEAIESLNALSPETCLVIECAGHGAVREYGTAILDRGLDLAILSAGVLADEAIYDALRHKAETQAAQLRVLSGAIGGIDALAAAGLHVSDVRYTARKAPQSWLGSPAERVVDLGNVDEPTAVFRGSARAAALQFPKNANVVATVALAGVGFDRTQVTLLADPGAAGNSHEIRAIGSGYELHFHTTGAALPANPKTSALTAQSVLRALRHETAGIVI